MVRARAIDDGAVMRSMRGVATRGRATRDGRARRARCEKRDARRVGFRRGDAGRRWRRRRAMARAGEGGEGGDEYVGSIARRAGTRAAGGATGGARDGRSSDRRD
jgi:hypothetical protein